MQAPRTPESEDFAERGGTTADAEMRALYAALPVGVGFLTPDLRYLRVNETLAQMNGRSVAAHVGASLDEVVGESAPELARALRQVMSSREPLKVELEAVPPGASGPRTFEATYFPVLDDDGALLGVGAVVADRTDAKAREREQMRLLQEALTARARAEAASVRFDDAREEAELVSADAQRARARIGLLAEAGRRMAQSMDWETTLSAVVASAVPAVADWAWLTVVEPRGALRVVAAAHRDPEREPLLRELAERYPPAPDAAVGSSHVVRTGEPDLLQDVSADTLRALAADPEHLRLMQALDVRHAAVAPLRTPEGVIGTLSFVLGESGRRFEHDDHELLTSLAARAALHIHNARLYTERSHIAHTLQTSLLPDAPPPIPGLEVAARYRPAGDENTVGGDFYDVFRSGERVWTAVVGDVSGKGAEAAAVTALARHTLRAASRLDEDPAANLALLNAALLDHTSSNFATVFYARLCPGEHGFDLRFANAGHLPPLLLRADGTLESVDGGRGPVVGAAADVQFSEATAQLAPGELLLLYTDGVTEVRPSDLALGERELRKTLAAHAGARPEEVLVAIERRAVELQDGRPRDDIALVAIKVSQPDGDGGAAA